LKLIKIVLLSNLGRLLTIPNGDTNWMRLVTPWYITTIS